MDMNGMDMGMGGMDMGMGSMKDMRKKKMMGMGMMGKMEGSSAMQSPLPGYPGISHLYHIGSSGFFLDHSEHIDLTREQQKQLAELQETSELNQADTNRAIEQAEQELWKLTSADSPEIQKIESKIKQIEQLKGKQRIAFIRAVGEATKVLSESQRQALVGETANEGGATDSQPDHSSH
jgi:hypothetical protein